MLLTDRREPFSAILNTRFQKILMSDWEKQDITSHVNFTGLIQKGEEAGLRLTGLVPQYRFLIGLGFLEEMEAIGKGLSGDRCAELTSFIKTSD